MNCKPGDLARIVPGRPAEDMIVRCVEFYSGPWSDGTYAPEWRLDREVPKMNGRADHFFADCYLRPIQPPPNTVTTEEVANLYQPSPNVTDKETA